MSTCFVVFLPVVIARFSVGFNTLYKHSSPVTLAYSTLSKARASGNLTARSPCMQLLLKSVLDSAPPYGLSMKQQRWLDAAVRVLANWQIAAEQIDAIGSVWTGKYSHLVSYVFP